MFDTETTGLIENRTVGLDRQPEVIEFYGAIVDLKTGEIVKEFDTLIRPTKALTPIITKITGLTDEALKDAKPFVDHSMKILELIQSAPLVIAHNFSFDRDMIEIEFARIGAGLVWPRAICTVEQSLCIKGHRLNLQSLYEHLFKEKFIGAHRARNDVKALIKCCVAMRQQEMI